MSVHTYIKTLLGLGTPANFYVSNTNHTKQTNIQGFHNFRYQVA